MHNLTRAQMQEQIKIMRKNLIDSWHEVLISDVGLEITIPEINGKEKERAQILELMELKTAKGKEMIDLLFSALDLLEEDLSCQS